MQLTTRQVCLIAGGLFPLTKLILLPSLLAYHMESDLLLPALLLFLLEGLVLFAVLFLSSRTDKTFYALVEDTLGSVFARILFFLYGIYFFLSSILPIFEQNLLLRSAFYDTIPSPLIMSSFAVLVGYFCMKPMRCLGRMAEIVVPISSVAILLLLFLSLGRLSVERFFPFLDFHGDKLIISSVRALPRFLDCAYPLFFMGHFKHEEGTTWKVLLSYFIGCLVVLFFLFDFYGIFSVLAPRESSAISKIARYFPGIETIGRIDLVLVYLFSAGYLLSLMLPLFLSVTCFDISLPYRYTRLTVSAILSIGLFLLYTFLQSSLAGIDVFFGKYGMPVFLVFSYLIPCLALFLRRKHG